MGVSRRQKQDTCTQKQEKRRRLMSQHQTPKKSSKLSDAVAVAAFALTLPALCVMNACLDSGLKSATRAWKARKTEPVTQVAEERPAPSPMPASQRFIHRHR
jgi:hypothetical protein